MSEQTNRAGGDEGTSGQSVPKSKFRQESEQAKISKSKLRMEKRGQKLDAARERLAKQKPLKKPGPVKRVGRAAERGVHGYVHGKFHQVEHENVGVEGAHRAELAGEFVLRHGTRFVKKRIRTAPARAVRKAETKSIRATADYHFRMAAQEHLELHKNAVSRFWQKRRLKKQYQKQAREAAKQGAKAARKTAVTTEKLARAAVGFVKRHPVGTLIALACVLLLFVMQSCMSSMVSLGNGVIGAVAASTYPAEDADMLAAEDAYAGMESELQDYLDSYERTHDYDEYHYDLDEIQHDPYVLISILSAWHEGAWTIDEVQGTLQMLFDRQYILTENVVTERRYYIETDTWTETDPVTGETTTHSESYRVYYDYYICTVTLENVNLSHVPIYIMGEEQLSRYALFMATLGNRPDLFPQSAYIGKYITGGYTDHDIPEEYLTDETFAAILPAAEKYLGYPYVWGGYNPSTSFDCSGYVSWVINHSAGMLGGWGAGALQHLHPHDLAPARRPRIFHRDV
jgi:hypothetical protein